VGGPTEKMPVRGDSYLLIGKKTKEEDIYHNIAAISVRGRGEGYTRHLFMV